MDINATLLGQMLVFGILIWFSWKFIWPPLTKASRTGRRRSRKASPPPSVARPSCRPPMGKPR